MITNQKNLDTRRNQLRGSIAEAKRQYSESGNWRILLYEMELLSITSKRCTNALIRRTQQADTNLYQHWLNNPHAWLRSVAANELDTQLLAIKDFGKSSLNELKAGARALLQQAVLPRQAIYNAIDRERHYQDAKWGPPDHPVAAWLLIIESELHEAKQAWVTGDGDIDALAEILQIAATAIACMEQHGTYERTENKPDATL
jgi:hypothetical protein